MEIVDPTEQAKHHHVWLQWLGLQEPPPEADSWVAVARGFEIDNPSDGSSRIAAQLVDALARADIEAHQRLYEFYKSMPGTLPRQSMDTCVAVVVHNRDLSAAIETAKSVEGQLHTESEEPMDGAVSDDELTRQALEAGPPPPD